MKNLTQFKIELIEMARTTPTADNTQPWKFLWEDRDSSQDLVLHVYHDSNAAKHDLNSGWNASFFSLGFLIETLSISAAEFGFNCETLGTISNRDLVRDNDLSLFATLKFAKQTPAKAFAQKDPLFHQLKKRQTNRFAYQPCELDYQVFQTMNSDKNSVSIDKDLDKDTASNTAQIHWTKNFNSNLAQYVAKTEGLLWDHLKLIKETMSWVRFNSKELQSTHTGLNLKGLGFNAIELIFIPLLRNNSVLKLMAPFISKIVLPQAIRKLFKSSAMVGCVTVPDNNIASLVQAGRLTMRKWLKLTEYGYSIHPYTIGSLNIYNTKNKILSAVFGQKESSLFLQGLQLMQKTFQFSTEATPVFLFRAGKAKQLAESQQTKRKSAADMILTEQVSTPKNTNSDYQHNWHEVQ